MSYAKISICTPFIMIHVIDTHSMNYAVSYEIAAK